jgi:hypothetical protein
MLKFIDRCLSWIRAREVEFYRRRMGFAVPDFDNLSSGIYFVEVLEPYREWRFFGPFWSKAQAIGPFWSKAQAKEWASDLPDGTWRLDS